VSIRSLAVAAAAAALSAPLARADAPFVYTVTTTSGTPDTVRVQSDSLIHATDEVILGLGRAAPLADRDVTANLRYAGVPDAFTLTLNADRTAGSLRYNLTRGPTDTFSAAGAPSFVSPARVIDDQVYSDLTDPHNHPFENVQQALNRQSYIMPLDGNPSAATAFLADETFQKYGLVRDGEPTGYGGPDDRVRYDSYGRAYLPAAQLYQPVYWFDTMGQSVNTNGFDGYDLRFSFNAAGRFAPVVGYSVSVPVQYRNINGAESDTVGVEVGIPVDILTPRRRQPFGWTVTPFAEFAVNDSRDLGSSQAIFDGGVASRLTFRFGRRDAWTLALADQFTGFVGLGADRDDGGYDGGDDYYGDQDAFRGHLAQQLFKNGVQVIRKFDYGVSASLSVTYSTFVANAATDQWWTPRLGVAWQCSPNFSVHLSYQADLANRYQSQGGDFQLDYKY
jgi:hypothetical protein